MLKVSNSIPISNYSQVVISDNSGAIFKPKTNSRVRVNLPSTLGMIDFHSSYFQLNTKILKNASQGTTNTYKMGWGNRQGAEQIVRDLIVRVDGRPLETITNYNVLDKARRDYAHDLTLNNLDAVYSHATLKPDNSSYGVQDWNTATETYTYNNISTKNQMQLDLSGLLSMRTGFPIVATGNVELEFILEDAENCLVPQHKMTPVSVTNITSEADGGVTAGAVTLTNSSSVEGFTDTDNPYAKGNVMEFKGTNGGAVSTRYFRITGVSSVTGGKVVVTSTDISTAGFLTASALTYTDCTITPMFNRTYVDKTTEPTLITSSEWNYEVNNVEFICRAIEMPPPYLNALQRRIQGEGLVMDCPTYSMYLSNIQKDLIKQSLLVPCYSSRVKGVLSCPLLSSQENYNYDRQGKVDGLREYQAKIGSRVEPQRPVDITNWTTDTQHEYHAQEHIQELTKTLNAVGIGERSLARWRDNFVFGRRLGAMGGSEDLSEKGFRWEVSYNSGTNSAKNVYNFVSMVKRLQIVPTGVNIFG
tara:strand:+ start:349 stop:1941 length:1593 start_codon:yes stop_codon:yes gene_type:complete